MKERIIVTGAAGFIGSHVVKKLLGEGYFVIGLDNMNDYYNPLQKEQNIKQFDLFDNFSFYKTDIENFDELESIFEKEEPSLVCHLAARAGVRSSILSPQIYESTNVQGTINLLELSRINDIKNFVYASSSSVYGDSKEYPFIESLSPLQPKSPYAVTKLACESYAQTYSRLHGLNTTGLRFFTVYGPAARPDMATFLFVDSVHKGKDIIQYGQGDTFRDYTFVGDIADGVLEAVKKPLGCEIINLGRGCPVSLSVLIKTIEDIMGKKASIKIESKQDFDSSGTHADITKAKKLLGYNPKTDLKDGLVEFVNWYNENYDILS